MAIHSELSIYKATYDLLSMAIDLVRNMPRDVKQVIGVRIESLQAISEEDAKAEGVEPVGAGFRHYFFPDEPQSAWEFATNSFASLWDKINGAGAWDKNPWVWVVEFKRATP